MNRARVRVVLKKGQARTHKSRQWRPQENYPETVSFLEHHAPELWSWWRPTPCKQLKAAVLLWSASSEKRETTAVKKWCVQQNNYTLGVTLGKGWAAWQLSKHKLWSSGCITHPLWPSSSGLHCITTQQLLLSPHPERGSLNTLSFLNKNPKPNQNGFSSHSPAHSFISHNRIKTQ